MTIHTYTHTHRFFDKRPASKALFANVNVDDMESDEWTAHTVRVVQGLDQLINMHYDKDILHEQLEHLGHQHAKYDGITSEDFEVCSCATVY